MAGKNYPGVFVWHGPYDGPKVARPKNILVLESTKDSLGWNNSMEFIPCRNICFDINSGCPVPYAPSMIIDIDWKTIPVRDSEDQLTSDHTDCASSAISGES